MAAKMKDPAIEPLEALGDPASVPKTNTENFKASGTKADDDDDDEAGVPGKLCTSTIRVFYPEAQANVFDSHCHLDRVLQKMCRSSHSAFENFADCRIEDKKLFEGCITSFCRPYEWKRVRLCNLPINCILFER
jgi:hypothetical protein